MASSGNPSSILDTNSWMSLSLADANLTISQVTVTVEEMAAAMEDLMFSSSSTSVYDCSSGGGSRI